MKQITGNWHTGSCNHKVKVHEIKNPLGDEGHNQDDYRQKMFSLIILRPAIISNSFFYYLRQIEPNNRFF